MSTGNYMTENEESYDVQRQGPKLYTCPNCFSEISGDDALYKANGEIIGCENCVEITDPWTEYEL